MKNDYFFAMPSLFSGLARTLDIGGMYDSGSYLVSATGFEADMRGMMVDQRMLQADLAAALASLEESQEKEQKAA